MQVDMASLEDRPDADGELLTASLALLQTVTLPALRMLLTCLGPDALQFIGFTNHAAMRANRTIRPEHRFDMSEGGRT